MKKETKDNSDGITLTRDNSKNIKLVAERYKNVLVCGVEGVGKITNTVAAFRDHSNLCYIGNPVDYEGKLRPGSYEKYLQYILSLKKDIRVIADFSELLQTEEELVLVIDEIFGRSEDELQLIGMLLDMKNIRVIQIVGCMKYMGKLVGSIDAIIELHRDGAFLIDKGLARAICEIFNRP